VSTNFTTLAIIEFWLAKDIKRAPSYAFIRNAA
jgi:hypothetical protein